MTKRQTKFAVIAGSIVAVGLALSAILFVYVPAEGDIEVRDSSPPDAEAEIIKSVRAGEISWVEASAETVGIMQRAALDGRAYSGQLDDDLAQRRDELQVPERVKTRSVVRRDGRLMTTYFKAPDATYVITTSTSADHPPVTIFSCSGGGECGARLRDDPNWRSRPAR